LRKEEPKVPQIDGNEAKDKDSTNVEETKKRKCDLFENPDRVFEQTGKQNLFH
jgi:hypothetical protein